MRAPLTRSVTLALGLISSSHLLADNEALDEAETKPSGMELASTRISAQGLGSTTEDTGSYTTGSTNTATKLNLSIRETPQSISVVTRQEMNDFNLNTLTEAMRHTTGVVVQHNDSDRVSYSSRGYTINNFQIDGMLNTFSYMKTDADTIIYDRIEVVRGATGLTTGAGDPSGTINMIRKRPTHELAATAGVSGGSYDDYYSYVDVGGPLGFDGRLRGRTVLAYRDSKSFRDNYALKREVAYGILEADLTDDTTVAVGYDYQDKQVRGSSWGTTPYWTGTGEKANLGRSTNYATPWSSWPKYDNTSPLFIGLNPEGYDRVPDWRDMGAIPKYRDLDSGIDSNHSTVKQKSGYLATRFNLTDQWHAVLGTRYGSWKSSNVDRAFDEKAPGGVSYQKAVQTHNDMITPYAGLLYDFTEELTAYVSYTDIFKPSTDKDVSGSYLKPVVGSVYEVGLKGSFLEERLNLTSAVFWSKQDNVPEIDDSVPRGPNGEEYYKSGGKGNKIKGFEVELAGEVMRGWNMMAGYTYTHSLNADGKRINTASPLNLVKVSTTYKLPGEWSAMTVGAAVNWQSDIYRAARRPDGTTDAKGNPNTFKENITQKSYTLLDLMARYEFDTHVSATLNVKNVLDQKYYDNVGFYNGVFWGEPRTVSLGLEWKL